MKFDELSDKDKVVYMRGEFHGLVENLFINRELFKDKFSPEEHKVMTDFLETIKEPECDCGECFMTSTIEAKIPPELKGLAKLAKENCMSKEY